MDSLITFIIPTICRPSLPLSIQTLQRQSNTNWKAVVCGDGCDPIVDRPHGDYNIIEDNRVIYIKAPHFSNQSKTRNYMIDICQTEWIGCLDDDDALMPEYVQYVEDNKDNNDIIIFKMNNYGDIIPFNHSLILGQVGISFAARADVMKAVPFPDPPAEDYYWLLRCEQLGYKIHYAEYIGYWVRPDWDNV
jgi:glycosyltransferase involved in cell wall biosynthesis